MADRDPFRLAGRAGSVDDVRQIVWLGVGMRTHRDRLGSDAIERHISAAAQQHREQRRGHVD